LLKRSQITWERDLEKLPKADEPLTVGIDGGAMPIHPLVSIVILRELWEKFWKTLNLRVVKRQKKPS
jgi:hypothetical protein